VAAMQKAGTPDIGYALARDRQTSASNFSPSPFQPGWRLGPLQWYKQKFGSAVTKVGTLVGDIESARASWEGQKAAMKHLGYEIIHEGEVSPTQTDYTTDVVQMQRKGVEFVMITALDVKGLARFARAMQQQRFKPKVFATGGIGYDANLFALAGDSVEGMYNDQQQALYLGEDAGSIPEVKLFQEWLQRTSPGAKADVFTAFGWTSGRLIAEAMQKAGPKLTRAGMIQALKGVTKFDSNGMQAVASPGTKTPPNCWVMIRVKGGKYVRETPASGYNCNGGFYRIPGT
jgi:branched-chain amino acid transport system substrate-binding protein